MTSDFVAKTLVDNTLVDSGEYDEPAATPGVTRRNALRLGALVGVSAAGTLAAVGCSAHGGIDAPDDSGADRAEVITAVADVPVGGAILATVKRRPVIISRPSDDEIVGFSAICTHQGCTVRPNGDRLDCPCHGSWFAAATGEVLRGPAELPLNPVDVRIADGNVVAGSDS